MNDWKLNYKTKLTRQNQRFLVLWCHFSDDQRDICKKINISMLKSTHEWGKTYTNISESVFDYDLESHLYKDS